MAEVEQEHGQEEQQQEEIEQHRKIRPRVVHEAIVQDGHEELDRTVSALVSSAFAAGLSMSLSLIVEGLLRAHLPDAPWRKLVVPLGYPFGFLVVILGRQQLFTENTLTAVLPFLDKRDLKTFWGVVRLWAVVLAGNVAGAHLAAWALGNTPAFPSEVQHHFTEISREALNPGFWTILLRGIFAGWIIALLVWILAALEGDGFAVIFVLTWLVAAGSFSHIIAGSVEVLFLAMTGQIPYGQFWTSFFVPALLGNSIGGVTLVTFLAHAQVRPDQEKDSY